MLIDFDETRETGGDVITRLQEVDRIFARMHAVQADLLTEAAGVKPQIDEYLLPDAWTDEQRRILIEDAARDELACALRRSSRVMQDMIDLARVLVGLVPEVLAALKAGRISLPHARLLADAAERLPAGTVEEFVARVLPVACRGTLAATRKAVKRAVGELDGEGQERRRERAKCTRDVWVSPDVDGMSLLCARMTTEMACALKVQIDADGFDRAFSVDAKKGLSIGEHRVEALAALVLGGNGHGTAPTTAHVNVTMDLPTLLGLRDGVASGSVDLAGAGPVPAQVVRELLEDPECTVTLRRLVTDPITGHLLDHGRRTYKIPQPLRDYIIARDRTCRFPGCNRRADLCQLDHAEAWEDGGETKPGNLGPLCTRHHQLKTFGGWEITESRLDGSCIWRSPQGRTYESGGPEPLPDLPDEN